MFDLDEFLVRCEKRSEWDEGTLEEASYDFDRVKRRFVQANASAALAPHPQ